MITVNIHEAKTHLSRLVELAVKGEPFIIAKAGRALVKVIALEPPKPADRLGFLEGKFSLPENFDRLGEAEIVEMFEG